MARKPAATRRAPAPLPAPRYTPWAATLVALTLCLLWLAALGVFGLVSN